MGIFKMYQYMDSSVLRGIDLTIRNEVLPYVKQFKSLPTDIQEDAKSVAEQESINCFFNNLKESWRQHNRTAMEVDAFLALFYGGRVALNDVSTLRHARRLIAEAFAVERKKRVYSAGVKSALEYHLPLLTDRFCLSQDDLNILLSIGRLNFWMYRYGEHCLYLLAKMEGNPRAKKIKKNIINVFHAGEHILFSSRIDDICRRVSGSRSLLEKEVINYERLARRARDIGIQGGYLTLGRADLKSVQGLIQYDNLDEYLFGYNLYGVPDLLLRKEVTRFLTGLGYLVELPSVLQYTEEEILSGLHEVEKCKYRCQ